jgi:hypothetical protein
MVICPNRLTNKLFNRYYINSSEYHQIPVTTARCNAATQTMTEVLSFSAAKQQYNSLHKVDIIHGATAKEKRMTCTCKHFCRVGICCSHVLAVYHIEKSLNLRDYLCSLEHVKHSGRPAKRTAALTRDTDPHADDTAKKFEKVNMFGADVRGDAGLLSGTVIDTNVLPTSSVHC